MHVLKHNTRKPKYRCHRNCATRSRRSNTQHNTTKHRHTSHEHLPLALKSLSCYIKVNQNEPIVSVRMSVQARRNIARCVVAKESGTLLRHVYSSRKQRYLFLFIHFFSFLHQIIPFALAMALFGCVFVVSFRCLCARDGFVLVRPVYGSLFETYLYVVRSLQY